MSHCCTRGDPCGIPVSPVIDVTCQTDQGSHRGPHVCHTYGCVVNSPHIPHCGEKKNCLKKNCPFSSLFHPFPWHSCPVQKKKFFFLKRNQRVKKHTGNDSSVAKESSPGVGKDTRPVSPLSKDRDYHTSVGEMETNDLLRSKVSNETHPKLYGDFFVVWSTFSDPSTTGCTWGLRTVRNRYSRQTKSRSRWSLWTVCQGVEGEGHTCQEERQGGQEIIGEWVIWRSCAQLRYNFGKKARMFKVFTNRWSVFHTPRMIMTTVLNLHPVFCGRDTDKGTDPDFDKVITDLAKTPDGWRTFVRRRGRGSLLCHGHWLRVWIPKWLWLYFCVIWLDTEGIRFFVFLYFLFTFIFIFSLHIYFYILSSEPVTCVDRYHTLFIKPLFFFSQTLLWMFISKKKIPTTHLVSPIPVLLRILRFILVLHVLWLDLVLSLPPWPSGTLVTPG